MSYQFEIFLSYRRSPTVGLWVKNHLAPRLQARIDEVAPFPVRISCDFQMESGVLWPDDLKRRLQSSAILLPVWSADYFRSEWCMAEWRSFREREVALGLFTARRPRGLIYPVRYADGEHFHEDAKRTECTIDFSQYNYPDEAFRNSAKYIEFDDKVQQMASELVPRLQAVPVWRRNFPIVEPAAMPPVHLLRTRI
jgi:hypothetical protein